MRTLTRRRFLSLAAVTPLVTAGCRGGFSLFGYHAGADALYDKDIRTVFVPLFNNRAFQTNPYRGFEIDVTQAVVREIGKTTTFYVTSNHETADTELLGNIVSITKTLLNRNQQNQIREAEIAVAVDVLWRDLRSGIILSNPRQKPMPGRFAPNPQIDAPPPPFDPNLPAPPDDRKLDVPQPQRLVATGRVIPELGESTATADSRIQQQIAVQIVSMMEKKW